MFTDLNFSRGLSVMDRLRMLATTPVLHIAAEALPRAGTKTKPSKLDNAGLLLLGAASVLYGNDRKADAELDTQWGLLRPTARAAGIDLPVRPASTSLFRYWRDHYLDAAVLAELTEVLLLVYLGMAEEMGFFPPARQDWLDPSPFNTLMADGTWFSPASSVGHQVPGEPKRRVSRAVTGPARVVADADRRGKAHGYCDVVFFVKGVHERQQLCLRSLRAPRGDEIGTAIPVVVDLNRRLNDRIECFVYDGAMAGTHHRALRQHGLLTVNKPKGIRSLGQWTTFQGGRAAKDKVHRRSLGCGHPHEINIAAGVVWNIQRSAVGKPIRSTIAEHVDCRRISVEDGYRFELDLRIPCQHGPDHILTLDPSETITIEERTINLAEQLRMLPVNHENFPKTYGLRNVTESGFSLLKNYLNMGERAGSYRRDAHELDLLLAMMVSNTQNWLEHRRSGRRAA